MFTPEIFTAAHHSVLCWLATCDASGQPNVSPKEIWALVSPNFVVIANIASPCSVCNIAENPVACVSFVDVFRQKGFKLQGVARNLESSHPEYGKWARPLEVRTQGKFTIQSVVVIEVTKIAPIVAPSYWMFPDVTSEESQVISAMRTYGVRSAKEPHAR